jgi:hypothetical protein
MNHLKAADELITAAADTSPDRDEANELALAAIAHALIALVERLPEGENE